MSTKRIIIRGGGFGGVKCAETLRDESPRYSQIVRPPKLAVRREIGAAMIENVKLFDRLLVEKKLKWEALSCR